MSVSVRHAAAVWRRNASMYARTWKWNILPNFFEPVFYLAAVGIGVGGYIEQMAGMSYVEFLAPGLVCVAAMNGASYEVTYNVFVRLNFEKAYDAMLTTPLDADDVLAGEVMWALTRSLIYGGCFYFIDCPQWPANCAWGSHLSCTVTLSAAWAVMPHTAKTAAIRPLITREERFIEHSLGWGKQNKTTGHQCKKLPSPPSRMEDGPPARATVELALPGHWWRPL